VAELTTATSDFEVFVPPDLGGVCVNGSSVASSNSSLGWVEENKIIFAVEGAQSAGTVAVEFEFTVFLPAQVG
jgi:hypothetical protein